MFRTPRRRIILSNIYNPQRSFVRFELNITELSQVEVNLNESIVDHTVDF